MSKISLCPFYVYSQSIVILHKVKSHQPGEMVAPSGPTSLLIHSLCQKSYANEQLTKRILSGDKLTGISVAVRLN